MLAKLVSGGQSGVDRAALDVALELGIPCGGWCPRWRTAAWANSTAPGTELVNRTAVRTIPGGSLF
jgi:hypothetical protein